MESDILQCIKMRRSVRKYQERQIGEEQLAALLEAAVWAPSGRNNQSWLFTAIQNGESLARLNEVVRQSLLSRDPDDVSPSIKAARTMAAKDGYNFYYHAPTLIIASNAPGNQNAMADCAAALQNIMLAATAMKLGSCWINQLRWLNEDRAVRSFLAGLGLPEAHVICGAAAIGHAGETPSPPARKKGTVLIAR